MLDRKQKWEAFQYRMNKSCDLKVHNLVCKKGFQKNSEFSLQRVVSLKNNQAEFGAMLEQKLYEHLCQST